jgi:sarcosine oxidase/L-pipecolate oxidase
VLWGLSLFFFFKFLPVIGKLVADLVENKMEPDLAVKFAVNRDISKKDMSRAGEVLKLNLDELYVPEDLQPKKKAVGVV